MYTFCGHIGIRIYALTNAYIRLGECLYGRWRMPVRALADARTGVVGCLYGRWRMNIGSWVHEHRQLGSVVRQKVTTQSTNHTGNLCQFD